MMSACRSLPFSMLVSDPTGYGPGSLSEAYRKETLTVGWVLSTTLNGQPYGGPPKSGCRLVVPAAIELSHCALRGWTGRLLMSVFQTLSEGKTWHVVPGTGAACAGMPLNNGPVIKIAPSSAALRIPTQ